jgi:hypothetical protein
MPEDTSSYTTLSGKRVSATYRGLLHFPRSIDETLSKQYVYDGNGTRSSLQIGGGSSGVGVDGDLNVNGGITLSRNASIYGILTINGGLTSNNTIQFNDLTIGKTSDPVTFRSLKQIETGNLRIRETTGDYEIIFGNPLNTSDSNLFTLKVDDRTNNFYIKNSYDVDDIEAPFWINRTTGEVNIRKLKTDAISNTKFVGTQNSNRNTIPVGQVTMFAASAAPAGWLKCDGSVYKQSDYMELYSLVKDNFKTLTTFDTATGFQIPLIPDHINNSIIYIIKW